jgi:hypothetical protein
MSSLYWLLLKRSSKTGEKQEHLLAYSYTDSLRGKKNKRTYCLMDIQIVMERKKI